ncbi:MAG: 4Fe-4S dicluster domain-containing protein [bacterium]
MALTGKEIIKRVRDAGVVGCGGAGFPTHIKIDARVSAVIANGAECEPILKTDQYIMAEHASEIVKGVELVMKASGAEKGYIALKAKYHKAVAAFKKKLVPGINVFELGNFYPAGDELVLVYEVTGRLVPEAGIPLNVGVIVDNVGTLLNVCKAVQNGEPVLGKYLTITGEVEKPVIVRCAIGSKIGDVVKLAKPLKQDYVLLSGGPMMGEIIDGDSVVTKTTGAVVVLSHDSPLVANRLRNRRVFKRMAKSICDQCMDCTLICPRNLIGHRIYPHRIMRMNYFDTDELNGITSGSFLCSQCGLCEIACPQGLSPKAVFRVVKENLISNGHKNILKETNLRVHSERDLRQFSALRVTQRLGMAKQDREAVFYPREFVPSKVKISLTGNPSEPVVKEGDKVKKGDLIARIPEKSLGANIHSSIKGTVVKVDGEFIYIEQRGN